MEEFISQTKLRKIDALFKTDFDTVDQFEIFLRFSKKMKNRIHHEFCEFHLSSNKLFPFHYKRHFSENHLVFLVEHPKFLNSCKNVVKNSSSAFKIKIPFIGQQKFRRKIRAFEVAVFGKKKKGTNFLHLKNSNNG